ncbi:MAG TPA: hypothetical protein DIC35_02520, partial [Candidatus Moranbacteria bacterium]|nr:hypothetical protein [Candidatus Moranbacteria bacterium]
ALIAAFLYAFSFWAINFSRISFRANMLPCILVFSFYFLFRGLRTKKWIDFSIGGFIFGLGMHSYIAWRIAPLLLILMVFFFILSRKNFLMIYWKHIITFILFSAIAASPMFWTFYQHPEYLEARDSVSIFSPQINQGEPVKTFLKSLFLSLQKYNFIGDMNWRHNFPPYPLLDQLTGLLFILGLIISFRRFIKKICIYAKQKTNDLDLERYSFLILWFFLMLAPEFMTGEGNPHALRSIGTLPVVIIFSAIGFEYLFEKARRKFPDNRNIFRISMAILLCIAVFNTLKYHIFWANKEKVGYSFNKNVTDMYRFIETLPKEQDKYVITTHNTLIKLPIFIFTSKDDSIHYFYPNELDKINTPDPENSIFLFMEKNEEAMNYIQKKYPQLVLEEKNYPLGSKFYIIKK